MITNPLEAYPDDDLPTFLTIAAEFDAVVAQAPPHLRTNAQLIGPLYRFAVALEAERRGIEVEQP